MELLGATRDNNLRFDKHLLNICLKSSRKLSALTRAAKFFHFKKGHILFKEFIESQFIYFPLAGIFQDGKSMIR